MLTGQWNAGNTSGSGTGAVARKNMAYTYVEYYLPALSVRLP
jgi:hypothetical protein